MPVLYAAVARRLGYPVYLAEAAEHLYLQWAGADAKFNIEATSEGGLMDHPDEYYWHWPHPVSPEQAEKYHYFKSLSPRDELADFLGMRALVLMKAGNMTGAVRCQMQAVEVSENNKAGMNTELTALRRAMAQRQLEQLDALLDQQDRKETLQAPLFINPHKP